MTVCVSEFLRKYSFQERALVAFKPRPILFIMNKICLNQKKLSTGLKILWLKSVSKTNVASIDYFNLLFVQMSKHHTNWDKVLFSIELNFPKHTNLQLFFLSM